MLTIFLIYNNSTKYKSLFLITCVTEDEYVQAECFKLHTIFTDGAVVSSRALTRETVLLVYTRAIVLTRVRGTFDTFWNWWWQPRYCFLISYLFKQWTCVWPFKEMWSESDNKSVHWQNTTFLCISFISFPSILI